MFSMFLGWMVVFALVFFRPRWAPAAAVVTLVLTLVLLKSHMSSSIPLNF